MNRRCGEPAVSENRAPAQYCPYCGEQDLWPSEASHGAWSCRSCTRVFAVKFLGLGRRGVDPSAAPDDTAAPQEVNAP